MATLNNVARNHAGVMLFASGNAIQKQTNETHPGFVKQTFAVKDLLHSPQHSDAVPPPASGI